MSDTPSHNIYVIGLPASGKGRGVFSRRSLVRFVHQFSVNCKLTLQKFDGETKYLDKIRDAWLEYEPVPRNKVRQAEFGNDGS